ncbi:MAG: hypothetical protein LWY06_14630 [Firmicutes bacterium]|nr:hypothetical protein [Bacillota bacterium]
MSKKHFASSLALFAVLAVLCLFINGCSGTNNDNTTSDGKTGTLYFVSTRDSSDGYSALIYSGELNFNEGTLDNVKSILGTDMFAYYNDLFVAPNGSTMFCSMSKGSLLYCNICRIDIPAGNLTALTSYDELNNIAPVFTSDHKIYYTSEVRETSQSQLRCMNTDGSDDTIIFTIPEGNVTSIGLSPDEKSLCLSVIDSNSNYDIYRYVISSGTYTNLTNTSTISEWSANYNPDGKIIYICKPYDNSDQTEIFSMDPNGDNPTQLTGGEKMFNGPLWQYSRWIAFQCENDIWLYDTQDQTISNLTGSQGTNYSHTLWVEE